MTVARVASAAAVVALLAGIAACAQPGTQAPVAQAAKLDVATNRISVACGYAEELTAFPGRHPGELAWIQSIAVSGAHKLASVFVHDQTDIYQGESVGAIMGDSISLLGDCGLIQAARVLKRAMARGH